MLGKSEWRIEDIKMSGWRKRQILERENMRDEIPNYRITYTINPNVDWSKVRLTYNKPQEKISDVTDMLIEKYLSKGDFSEAIAIIDRIRNDR